MYIERCFTNRLGIKNTRAVLIAPGTKRKNIEIYLKHRNLFKTLNVNEWFL